MSGKEVRINMKRTEIVAKTEELVTPIIEENHFELVDVEYVREGANWYLRVYADKEGGINIDDCVLISRALEEKLDAEDFISDASLTNPGALTPILSTSSKYLAFEHI